ncbi:polysaccharide pyruvyl transferase family protein [Marinobacter sp.]|uniref:polysaccharide pyruvyl transferase family protein n=1 Tax=Marinobacter sp. TaxID=50741 RepID=UPI0034A146F8
MKNIKLLKLSPIYGNNSGDVAISKCIEYLFSNKKVGVTSEDLLFRVPFSYTPGRGVKNNRIAISTFLQYNFPIFFYVLKKLIFVLSGDRKKLRSKLESYDALIFGGGNIVMTKMGSDYGYRLLSFSKNLNKPIIIFGAGAGPLPYDSKKIINGLAKNCDKLYLRDKVSLEYFPPDFKKAQVVIDPAFVISDIAPPVKKNKGQYLGVNIIYGFLNHDDFVELAHSVAKLARDNLLGIKVICTAYPHDALESLKFKDLVQSIQSGLTVKVINVPGEPTGIADSYADVAYFIGCRMHSLIFALSYGIPSIGFAWDPKVRGMFEMFCRNKDILEEFMVGDPGRISFDVYRSFNINSAVARAKKDVYKAVDEIVMELLNVTKTK